MPRKSRRFLVFLSFICLLAGCRQASTPTASNPEKTFPVRGKVIAIDATHVTLDHEAVPGFMDAMTMPYKLKDPSTASELHPGDLITARIVVQQDATGYHDAELDNIVVIAQARPDYKPAVQYHIPNPGDEIPDFHFRNQSDRTIHLSQFKGKTVLVTFIYTRCPMADFCPRMSRNFADIDKALSADPALYNQTHLLSISFDPAYDTPKVLKSYGGAYTGKYVNETFQHWEFAAPPAAEMPRMQQFFDIGITPGDNGTLQHSLSTVVIGKDGKVVAFWPTNDWDVADVLAKIKAAT